MRGLGVGLRYPSRVQRLIITLGLLIALVGLLWPWIAKLGLGRLPGDLRIDKPGFTLYAPFTTMLIVSVVVSLVIWLLRR
jgi:ribose/xylose/arabinose/galactoside ABC-type transport system permease subunit